MRHQRLDVIPQHSAETLWAAYQRSNDAVERRRIQLIALLVEGKNREEARHITQYSLVSVIKCIKLYNASGLTDLRDGRADNPGAPTLLNEDQTKRLIQAIQDAYKAGTLWNGAAVQAWVKEQFQLEIYPGRAYEYLDAAGFSHKRQRSVHVRGNDEEKEAFKGDS